MPPGTSLEESNRIGNVIETVLHDVPEVVSTTRRTGRAELDEHAAGVNTSEIEVVVKEGDRSHAEFMENVRQRLAQIPGVENVGFRDSIVQGSMERLNPILMTALVLGVGLVPLALGVGEPGKEIQQPMAVVILGGIVSSTVLNMIVLPALYLKYGRAGFKAAARDYPGETNLAPVGE